MKTFKCSTCGGALEITSDGGLICTYCGSKSYFSDTDFAENEEFRKKLLAFQKAENINKESDYSSDFFFSNNNSASFEMDSGYSLDIDYMKEYKYDGFSCYLAKENVVYVFDKIQEADKFIAGLNRLTFPEADTKLNRCFPEFKTKIKLAGDKIALVFLRRPNFYPAEMFMPWPSEHLAWVISRMENICCELEFSEITHHNISPISFWINPVTHEGCLYGDWRSVSVKINNTDLQSLRKTAIQLAENTANPMQMHLFLNEKPANNAYDDFSIWNEVIEKGFGGHKFINM